MQEQTPTTARLTRLVFVVAVVAVTITMIIASVVMNTPLGPSVVIPGPLSAQHAMLTEDCSNCHSAEMDSTKGVLHGMTNSALSLRDSERCLDCHDLGPNALRAHAMTSAALGASTASVIAAAEGRAPEPPTGFGLPPHSESGEFACSVCHVEHAGRRNDLTAMSESQCQACHAVRFDNFEQGHPEFTGYPYGRRLRIAFDHAKHIHHNFKANNPADAPTSCTDCHSVDPTGAFMRTAPFEASCARCHEQDTLATARTGGPGVAFLALPALDTITLDEGGIAIGQWPADSGIADGALTPFMRLLLAGDRQVAADLVVIEGLDLLDLRNASPEQLSAVGRVAWAIKALLAELAQGGHEAIARRVSVAVGDPDLTKRRPMLTGRLTRALVRDSVGVWLPDLDEELAQRGEGDSPATDMMEDASFDEVEATGQAWSSFGGWYRDDLAFAIKYRPTGHGDPFLRAWTELAASSPGAGARMLADFAKPTAVGQCLKCHSVDQTEGSALSVNWFARRPGDGSPWLTRFSHAPHLPLLDENGCLSCHKIEPQGAAFQEAYAQRDPHVFTSAMAPIERAQCVTCHTPSKVATTCLDCHDYHQHRPTTRLRLGAPLTPIVRDEAPSGD